MKALLSRFTRNKFSNTSKNDRDQSREEKNAPVLPPLPQWPPQQQQQQQPPPAPPKQREDHTTPKPLPEIDDPPPPPIHALDLQRPLSNQSSTRPATRTAKHTPSSNTASMAMSNVTDKKVAFISPPPTPTPQLGLTGHPPASPHSSSSPPQKAATQPSDSRTNLSNNRSGSRMSSAATVAATKASRSVTSPNYSTRTFSQANQPDILSLRSGTPYSQSANSSRILAAPSWSEAAEEDLVSNLGPRERTRQEVLWEIVASEERYVAELIKMKETFIDPLLHPFSAAPVSIATPPLPDANMGLSIVDDFQQLYHYANPQESLENLPIAARFLSTPDPQPQPQVHNRTETPKIHGESSDDDEGDQMGRGYQSSASGHGHRDNNATHPRSPYRGGTATSTRPARAVPFPSRSHQSLPPPPRADPKAISTTSVGRAGYGGLGITDSPMRTENDRDALDRATETLRKSSATPSSRLYRKLKKNTPPVGVAHPNNPYGHMANAVIEGAVPPHVLPEELRRCLEVIEGGIINGHMILADGLRKRYEEQYPLVRSLADIFVANSHILREYATYVLHLESALEQVDNALATATMNSRQQTSNTRKTTVDSAEWLKISKFLFRLEEMAAEKAETGLAISLSKPFQRLLKYPLLFQNLLFHTDPSTYEYESTLQMVGEVESIVRSIEDEKIQKEERDKTRDAWARIDGVEKEKALAVPKSSRVLVKEEPLFPNAQPDIGKPKGTGPPSAAASKAGSGVPGPVKGKNSFKRFSDVLSPSSGAAHGGGGIIPSIGKKKDIWLVTFNDVVLRCQRTGVTTLPIATTTNNRTNSMPELVPGAGGKTKYATTGAQSGRRSTVKPRNMYKFISIENWTIGNAPKSDGGLVLMEDIGRIRQHVLSDPLPPGHQRDMEEQIDEGEDYDSDDSDRKSKMSFSYWGADKITVQNPGLLVSGVGSSKGRKTNTGTSARGRRVAASGTKLGVGAYGRESSANAKFGTRLITEDSPAKAAARPSSRRHGAQSTQSSSHSHATRKTTGAVSDESAIKSTTASTRPPWDGSTRATLTSPTPRGPGARVRVNSQSTVSPGHSQSATTTSGTGSGSGVTVSTKVASIAPSEDSGVGMYRQMLAQNPSFEREIHEKS